MRITGFLAALTHPFGLLFGFASILIAGTAALAFRSLRAFPGGLKLGQMLFSPPADRLEGLDQTSPERSEGILNHRRNYRINLPVYDAVIFETAQRLGKHLLGDSGNLSLQLAVALRAAREDANNQRSPLVRDAVKHLPGVAFRIQYGRAGGGP